MLLSSGFFLGLYQIQASSWDLLANTMLDFYIRFVNDLDPGRM